MSNMGENMTSSINRCLVTYSMLSVSMFGEVKITTRIGSISPMSARLCVQAPSHSDAHCYSAAFCTFQTRCVISQTLTSADHQCVFSMGLSTQYLMNKLFYML
jgi:hypothetical protein